MTARPNLAPFVPEAVVAGGKAATAGQRQAQFELGVALALALWPALTLAVQQQWGGTQSADKRDWFAGAIVDLFGEPAAAHAHARAPGAAPSPAAVEIEDVETMLLQVMLDEFEVNVDDESAWETATLVCRLWMDCGKGDFREVQRLRERWEDRGRGRGAEEVRFQRVEVQDLEGDEEEMNEEDDEEDEDIDDEDEDEDGDVEMGDAPPPTARGKVLPEVDEDGFTKVTGKKKR